MGYFYSTGGLTVKSEFLIYQLMPAPEPIQCDVEINYGKVPDVSFGEGQFKTILETHSGFVFGVADFAIFKVEHWSKITVHPLCSDPKDWQIFLLSSVIGRILLQKGLLLFQGGSFVHRKKAYLVLGPPGVGKSSVLAGLGNEGYDVLADHYSSLKVIGKKWHVAPSFQKLKLWEDAIQKLEISDVSSCQVRSSLNKYYIDVTPKKNTSVELAGIFFLAIHPVLTVDYKLEELSDLEKLTALSNTSYLDIPTSLNSSKFNRLVSLSRLESYKVSRPSSMMNPNKLVSFIRKNLPK